MEAQKTSLTNSGLAEIKLQLQDEILSLDRVLKASIHSRVRFMNIIMNYVTKSKGKQIRPLFVFLCAGAFGKISEATSRGAALIEMLHTATLVHDDVVDESNYRRGILSVNAIWKNKLAVLSGDYLLAKGLLLSITNKDFAFLEIVSEAVREMSEGELLQLEKSKRMDIDESTYFEIIRKKTAVLISCCCAVGAQSVGASAQEVGLARSFGEKVGIAFQLKDDLLDFRLNSTGKPASTDIHTRKLSLPLIYGIEKADLFTRFEIWRRMLKKRKTPLDISKITSFAFDSGGVDYTNRKIDATLKEATEILSHFPPSAYRDSLEQLTMFVVQRRF